MPKSRWAEWAENYGKAPALPDIAPLGYIGELFDRTGRIVNNGMGISPLPFSEIKAFAEIEGLDRVECRYLRQMSEAFHRGLNSGADDFSAPPWKDAKSGFWE